MEINLEKQKQIMSIIFTMPSTKLSPLSGSSLSGILSKRSVDMRLGPHSIEEESTWKHQHPASIPIFLTLKVPRKWLV